MKKMSIVKILFYTLMVVSLFQSLLYTIFSEIFHEIIGTITLAFFLIHFIEKRQFYLNVLKGKYVLIRYVQTSINLLLLFALVGLLVSGLSISFYLYKDFPFKINIALARRIHLICVHLIIPLLGLHLGFHIKTILFKLKKLSPYVYNLSMSRLLQLSLYLISFYGIYIFINNNYLGYILGFEEFAILDYERGLLLQLFDILAVLVLFSIAGFFLLKKIMVSNKRK